MVQIELMHCHAGSAREIDSLNSTVFHSMFMTSAKQNVPIAASLGPVQATAHGCTSRHLSLSLGWRSCGTQHELLSQSLIKLWEGQAAQLATIEKIQIAELCTCKRHVLHRMIRQEVGSAASASAMMSL